MNYLTPSGRLVESRGRRAKTRFLVRPPVHGFHPGHCYLQEDPGR
jgi:hypothetical protein